METYVVRVWLSDKPGVLGQVASNIGAIGGDVIGIEILERGGGQAVDELIVALPDSVSAGDLAASVSAVPGAGLEEVRLVAGDRPDATVVALEAAARLAEMEPAKRVDGLAREVVELFEATWVNVIDMATGDSVVAMGSGPEAPWLAAFVAGSRHLAPEDRATTVPADLAWAKVDAHNLAIAVGRPAAFRARERHQLAMLARIASALSIDPGA